MHFILAAIVFLALVCWLQRPPRISKAELRRRAEAAAAFEAEQAKRKAELARREARRAIPPARTPWNDHDRDPDDYHGLRYDRDIGDWT